MFAEWANNMHSVCYGIQFESTSLSPMSCVYHAAHTYMHAHTYVRTRITTFSTLVMECCTSFLVKGHHEQMHTILVPVLYSFGTSPLFLQDSSRPLHPHQKEIESIHLLFVVFLVPSESDQV